MRSEITVEKDDLLELVDVLIFSTWEIMTQHTFMALKCFEYLISRHCNAHRVHSIFNLVLMF